MIFLSVKANTISIAQSETGEKRELIVKLCRWNLRIRMLKKTLETIFLAPKNVLHVHTGRRIRMSRTSAVFLQQQGKKTNGSTHRDIIIDSFDYNMQEVFILGDERGEIKTFVERIVDIHTP